MEKFFVSNQLNEVEILKTLSKNGVNTFGYRILNTLELSKRVLIQNGIILDKEIISSTKAVALMYKFIKERKEFFKSASTYNDAQKIYSSIKSLRSMVLEDEIKTLEKIYSENEKEKEIVSIIKKYKQYLSENNLIDDIDILRMAIDCPNKDLDITVFKEYHNTPLENHFFNKFKKYKKVSILSLFSKSNKGIDFDDIYKCYGYSNEIERIFSYVCEKKIPFSDVLIVTPQSYPVMRIKNTAGKYDIPILFNDGCHIKQSNVYNFLLDYITCSINESWSIKGIKKLYYSKSINTNNLYKYITGTENIDKNIEANILKIAGNLRIDGSKEASNRIDYYKNVLLEYKQFITNYHTDTQQQKDYIAKSLSLNPYENTDNLLDLQYVDYIYKFNDALKDGPYIFYKNYGHKEKNSFDDELIFKSLIKMIDEFIEINNEFDIKLIDIFTSSIVLGSKISDENCVYVSSITNAINTLRKYIFIIGFDSNLLAIPSENYFVLDDEYKLFGDLDFVPTSINVVKYNQQMYLDFLKIFNSLGSHIQISYSCFDETEIREINQSSLLFKLFLEKNPKDTIDDFEKKYLINNFFGYEDNSINLNSEIIKEKSNNKLVKKRPIISKNEFELKDPKKITASKLSNFDCPFKFLHNKLLGLDLFEDQKIDEAITSLEKGNLTHSVAEFLVDFKPSYDEFISYVNKRLEVHFAGHYPIINSIQDDFRNEFIRSCNNLYTDFHNLKNSLTEYQLAETVYTYQGDKEEFKGKTIIVYGRTDRVDISKDGKVYKIVDYKSNGTIFKYDDEYNILETLLYSYILRTEGKEIYQNEYIFTTHDNYVYRVNVDEKMTLLYQKLDELIEHFYQGDWEKTPSEDACKYCKLKGLICMTGQGGEEDE